jgi:hypothetical protein
MPKREREMAILIRAGGEMDPVMPKDGQFTLDELRTMLGCQLVDEAKVASGQLLIFDPEARLKNPLPQLNYIASYLAETFLRGHVLLVEKDEVQ